MKALPVFSLIFFSLFYFSVAAQDLKKLDQNVTGLVYVKQLDKIFITVGSDSGPNSNSICMVDPYFGRIERSFFVGSNPRELAASDDGKFLYTTLAGVNKVFRFNTETEQIDLEIPLGGDNDFLGPFFAEDIEVMPNHPTTIAVSLMNGCCSPRHEGVAIFDGAIQRPLTTPDHTGSNRIEFAESDTILYGYNNETTDFGFRTMLITNEGLTVTDTRNGLIDGFGVDMEYGNGYVFSTNGSIIDVSGGAPERVGLLSTSGAVAVVPDSDIVHYLYGESEGIVIRTIDLTTFGEISGTFIPNIGGEVRKALVWGEENNIAFYTSPGFSSSAPPKLVILRNCTSEVTEAPTISPSGNIAACAGTPVTLTASGSDNYFWSNGSNNDTIVTLIAGLYQVATLDATGCAGPPSEIARVTFQDPPFQPSISGPDLQSFCAGGATELVASGFGDFQSYLWSNEAMGEKITVNTPGSYSVRLVSAIGCLSLPSNPVTVQQRADSVPPRPALEITGDTALCSGETALLVAPAGYPLYYWNRTDEAFGGFLDINHSLQVFFTSSYSVSVENEAGCRSLPSDTVSVVAYQTPGQPFIQVNNNLLACSITGESYQWYLNDELIEGANERFYEATRSGFYSVEVTVNGCTSPVSQLASIIVTSVKSLKNAPEVNVYPNPTSEWLHIESPAVPLGRIILSGITGRQVLQEEMVASPDRNYSFDLATLPSGVYLVQLFDHENRLVRAERVVKME